MKTLLNKLQGDRVIWMTAMILAVISLLAVYSSISSLAFKREGGSTLHFLMKHGIMLVTGGVIMYYASMLKYSMYSRLSQLAISIVAGLLLLTLLLGSNINDASRWITIPIINQSFQTSDLAKVVLIVYLARVIGKQQDKEWTFRDVLVNLMVPVGVICGLILPANFSTAALLFLLCMIIMFIGEVPIKWLLAIVGLAVGSFVLLVMANEALELDVLPRVETWTNRVSNFGGDDRNANYQVEHAKIAIASGGLLPNGPGSGNSRNWLPHPYSDMIYAFIIEEYGSIIGGLGLLLLYLILLFRAVKIAGRCDKKFGSLVAVGLSLMLVLQAMINMAVAVDLVPVTGQPLPLVSMGGTSVWFTCLAIGIVLSVSRSIDDIQIIKKDAKPRTAVA
ncbi:MAG: FtsW/RodA/SpoVE family cell cycle protein [Flavobacteriales bacterium]|nr:FtsW/RodA/SpoVE family cell cycle protein [Flavobacteriales bacterium]MBK6943814.1 FtsW/RodA/SpoVE family cell cycle protein [Flavobacteriales bacterium]MBK7240024.1 FtsW/RodA/SpoVE family cell cycle protein [Flavobacteriales bacterium]MBK7297073.1 FtsW/RodA/SpoVE family cell cycle protein [Flavobacteriales bacterium]MBP9138642.1 FtsW/RodA/SpoVE family cell cycle protein [Flavobacteriales bacterium]